MREAGIFVPLINPYWGRTMPPLARQWADPSFTIAGWEVVSTPLPGDVASNGGHMGIVSGPNIVISASSTDGVVNNNWGFRTESGAPDKNMVFRRRVCRRP